MSGPTDSFPKGLLGNFVKYIEIQKPKYRGKSGEPDCIQIQRRLVELAGISNEQSQKLKTWSESIKELEKTSELWKGS